MVTNNSKLWKLSPSDFKYLWEECKCCFWRKVHIGEYRPSIFPSIFNKMSGMLQRNVLDTSTVDLAKGIPNGRFVREEDFIQSKPFPSGKSYILGRFDLLTEFDDGTYGVIDLKMVDPHEDALEKFDRQLHAYKYALENPDNGEPIEVQKLGLLILEPTDIKPHEGFVYYKARPQWKEIEINMDKFYEFINEVEEVLISPEPEPKSSCQFCKYKNSP